MPPNHKTKQTKSDKSAANPALTPDHGDYFRTRAVSEKVALAHGIESLSADEIETRLGFSLKEQVGGIGFAYPGTKPAYTRVRLDNGKYLAPAGRDVPLYVPFGQDDPTKPLLVAESPTKSLALTQAGFVGVGLGGVATCLTKDGELNESWSRVHLKDRSVVILFDNDLHKPAVAWALDRLARALKAAGAVVTMAMLPRGAMKMGPDDYLVAYGKDALKAVLDAAVPALPVERLTLVEKVSDARERHAQLAQLLADPTFITGLLNGGPAERAVCREPFREARMGRDLQAALTAGRQTLAEAHNSGGAGGLRHYDLVDGAFQSEDGTRLTNFDARILQDVERDDGARVLRLFVVGLTLENGTNLGTAALEPREFLTIRWPTEKFGAAVRVAPGPNSMREVADAVQAFSEPESVKIFERTGWVEVDGVPHFLMPERGGPASPLVELPTGLWRYSFPRNTVDLAAAFGVVQRLCDVAPDRITLPLVLAALRAPLNSLLPTDFVVHLHGTTGGFKSTLAALVLSFFGEFSHNTLPASFSDTSASLELKANVLHDVVFCADELTVRSSSSYDETLAKANTLVRGVGNGAARGRLDRNLSARPDRPPHALVLTTGEQLPAGESILARTLSIAVQRGDVDQPTLSVVQANAGTLAPFMKSYTQWLAPRLGPIGAWIGPRHRRLRDDFQRSGTHRRAPSTLAHLLLGAELALEFLEHQGLLVRRDADAFRERAERALIDATAQQHEVVANASPSQLFLSILADLIQSKAVQLGDAGHPAADAPYPRLVGWRSRGEIWLLPEMAFSAVATTLRERGEQMPVPAATLWRRLRDEGFVVTDNDGKPPKRKVGSERKRVVVLRASALEAFCTADPIPNARPGLPRRAMPSGAKAERGQA